MKIFRVTAAALLLMPYAASAYAQSSLVAIPQVSDNPKSPATLGAQETTIDDTDALRQDHQAAVLNDPTISDYARAQAAISQNAPTGTAGANIAVIDQDAAGKPSEAQLGGNVAIIKQEGSSNRSSVVQSGNNNVASQTQKGNSNDIYLNQQGNNNRSQETQKGDHNHKTKIQNGNETDESTDTAQ